MIYKSQIILLIILLCNCLETYGHEVQAYKNHKEDTFSLMFNDSECHDIYSSRQRSLVTPPVAAPLTNLHLQGIAFVNSRQWTVWINNERIDPDHPHPNFNVIAVSPSKVNVALQKAGFNASVELHINQTLDLSKVHYVEHDSALKIDDKTS